MKDPTTILAAAYMLNLERFDNLKLAALNNAVQLWGWVDPKNITCADALASDFITPEGRLKDADAFKLACASEVNRRVREGTFN